MLLAHLAVEAPEHFGGDDVDALFGVDIALAKWEDPRATNPGFLAACVLRASGLDEAERRAADAPPAGSRAKINQAHPVDRAVSAARGRAASMFNLVLSSLDLRGGAHTASLCVLFDEMPSARVAPDVVSHALVAAACVAGGDDQGAAAALAAARRDAGAFSSPKTKNKTPTGTHATESQLGMNIRVLYEDAHLLAVSKPAGVLTHEPSGEFKKKKKARDDTSVSSALVRLYGADGLSAVSARTSGPGIVHRLDRPTTGVVLVAKTDEAHLSLVAQWFQRRVKKTYLALTERHPGDVDKRRLKTKSRASAGTVVAPVDGKPALSDWRVVETFEGDASAPCALVEVRPLTGRKHQIRAHMGLERRAPLAGDPLYRNGQKSRVPACVEDALFFASSSETEKGSVGTGTARSKKKAKPASALFLHSKSIELEHPITGEALVLEDPPPPAFEAVLEALRKMEK